MPRNNNDDADGGKINAYVKCQRSRQTVANSSYQLRRIGPTVYMEQRHTHWTNFREISYLDLLINFEHLKKIF